jgi:hypothetical protein
MKNSLKKTSITMALVSMLGIGIGANNVSYAENAVIGAQAALNDKSYTQEEMITYALQDEYLAKAEYEKLSAHSTSLDLLAIFYEQKKLISI